MWSQVRTGAHSLLQRGMQGMGSLMFGEAIESKGRFIIRMLGIVFIMSFVSIVMTIIFGIQLQMMSSYQPNPLLTRLPPPQSQYAPLPAATSTTVVDAVR